MYNPEQKQYILKNSLGVSYHVYFEQGRGLCIRMLSDSRIWSRGYVLDKSAINDFSAVLDKNDIFHFFFQTRDGKLVYGHGMHGQIESRRYWAVKIRRHGRNMYPCWLWKRQCYSFMLSGIKTGI